jgi:hypothetical protein
MAAPDDRPPRQDLALNLSAKRRLCNTVGKRFIDGTARCCAVSAARSLAATTTNLARSSLAFWSLRRIPSGAKSSSVLVNLFTICLPMRPVASDHDQILSLITAISWLSNPATTQLGTQSAEGTQSWDPGPTAEIPGANC